MKLLRQILGPLFALCFALASAPVCALPPARTAVVLSGVQGWSFPGSSADLYFARNAGSCTVNRLLKPCASLLTITRASTEMAPWSDQHWTSFASGTPAITDFGLSVWQAATNTALQARDLTQAAWVAVNMTTALTATGIDNTANSATKLTAAAGNATVLQTLTIGSTAETFSIFVERVTGTGNIQITENNGGTWTTMTSANCVNTQGVGTAINTTAYVRCSVEAVLANPVIGVRIVTSGDVVNVDFAQNEANAFPTPPIATTTVAVTRAADNIALAGAAFTAASQATLSVFGKTLGLAASANNAVILGQNGADRAFLYADHVSGSTSLGSYDGTNVLVTGNAAAFTSATVPVKGATAVTASARTLSLSGGTVVSQTNLFAATTSATVGNNGGISRALNGFLQRLTIWSVGLSGGQLQAVTQ